MPSDGKASPLEGLQVQGMKDSSCVGGMQTSPDCVLRCCRYCSALEGGYFPVPGI